MNDPVWVQGGVGIRTEANRSDERLPPGGWRTGGSGAGHTRRRDLSTAAYERLRDAIVTLKLAPGAALIEVELCDRLRVSRTPMRAALQRLQQEGLAVIAGSGRLRRLVVSPLTFDDMRELFLMVGALDGLAARLAAGLEPARRGPLLQEMERLNGELRCLAGSSELWDTALAQDLDVRFHQSYEQTAAGPQLLLELHALHARRARYVRVYTEALVRARNLRESALEHQAIIDAVKSGDRDAAERAAGLNYHNALERYATIVKTVGERGAW
jgi:DNA-binding GntR family transcriptional regulator